MGVCLVGTSRIDVSFDVLKTFGRKIPYVDRIYSVGQSQVGSLYSYNLALEFDQPGAAKNPDNLQKFDQLVADIATLELTKKTTSLLQILKDLNQVMHEGDPAWYRVPESRDMVAQLVLLYENASGDEVERWIDYDYQRLKLQVEMGHYSSGEVARELHWIRGEAARLFPDAHVVLTLNFSAYMVSVVKVFISMGFLVGAGLFAALAADFFITPVLLSMTKPFGPERRGW